LICLYDFSLLNKIKKQADWKATCVGLVDRSHEKTVLYLHPVNNRMLFAVLKVGRKRMEDENELPGHEN